MEDSNKSKDKFRNLSTKVSTEAWQRMNRIAKSKGMSIYDLLQMVCDTLIRYMDDRHNLTEEMERAMSIFEHLSGWKNSINLADPTIEAEVGEAIYFIYDARGKSKGCRAVHVSKPLFGIWSQDENIQHIIERLLCLVTPERYKRLRLLAVELECNSILELFDKLIDHHSKDSDLKEFRQSFEDANRDNFGKTIEFGHKPKQRHSRTVGMFDKIIIDEDAQ